MTRYGRGELVWGSGEKVIMTYIRLFVRSTQKSKSVDKDTARCEPAPATRSRDPD
jgi:hypothetical protein